MFSKLRSNIAQRISKIPLPTIWEEPVPPLNKPRLINTPDNQLRLKINILSLPKSILDNLIISNDMLFSIPNISTETLFLGIKEPKQFEYTNLITDITAILITQFFHPLNKCRLLD
ncbi:MAG: hypothetical protein KJ822_18850 [Proteobacteria bacterium]|nr:hypothetical protein [Pseudomonadota bacterium]